MVYTLDIFAQMLEGRLITSVEGIEIGNLGFDSRSISFPTQTAFFALHSAHSDGHDFIADAYQKGVRCFVVDRKVDLSMLPDAAVIQVSNTLQALQRAAQLHRQRFSLPIIGITGSNGKTVVKEWLYQLLQQDYHIVRSPKSYNSQIGVPVSVWQLNASHTLGIFEAGISKPGEMDAVASIIQPQIGILTNIGEAHSENFDHIDEKASEKVKLFREAAVLIWPADDAVAARAVASIKEINSSQHQISWGHSENASFRILQADTIAKDTTLTAAYDNRSLHFVLPFADVASIHNCITCICVLLYLGIEIASIQQRLAQLHTVDMRLQLLHGINGCTIINDSYSADLTSLHIALHFLAHQQTGKKRTVIISDIFESGRDEHTLYNVMASALQQHGVQRVIAIGEQISKHLPQLLPAAIVHEVYHDTEQFLQHYRSSTFFNETILVKGARRFRFERIVSLLETKIHQTRLEIDLNALAYNLKQYQKLLQPQTRIMVMVKAFSYGSGSAEIANVLQFNHVHYLGVAYADEGIALRRSGIRLPIMVMNADEHSFQAIIEHQLQPVLYSKDVLQQFENAVRQAGMQQYPVHLEIETGMHRLGFDANEIEAISRYLSSNDFLQVQSVFSHLAANEDETQDAFTVEQSEIFNKAVIMLRSYLDYTFLEHIANSAAIVRHPKLQKDMVRLGIGIYGIEIQTKQLELQPVASLKATIAQLKHLEPGDTVSYNRRGIVKERSVIATIRIGYADGYSRRLGNGVGKMYVNGHLAPVVGTVCMDMTMIDVTGIPDVKEGGEVVVFGKQLPVQQLAEWMGTIPYEVMTSISHRVTRIYFQE